MATDTHTHTHTDTHSDAHMQTRTHNQRPQTQTCFAHTHTHTHSHMKARRRAARLRRGNAAARIVRGNAAARLRRGIAAANSIHMFAYDAAAMPLQAARVAFFLFPSHVDAVSTQMTSKPRSSSRRWRQANIKRTSPASHSSGAAVCL